MQVKITSFFRSPNAPQPSNTTVEDFVPSETTEPEIRITYNRQTPKQDSIFCRNNENNLETDLEPESPVSLDAPANPISNSSRIINKKRSYAQLHLELGQSDFLLHTCSACGLKYARGEEGDEKVHKEYHKNSINGIKFKGWRHERVISADVDSGVRIILVLDDDPSSQMNKVREVLKMVEGDLGLCEDWLFHKLCKVYLFIAAHRIAGCLVAEPIKTAYRVVSNFEAKSSSNNSYIKKHKSNLTMLQFGGFHFHQEVTKKAQHVKKSERFDDDCDRAIFCEEEAEPALCGVRAIWVAPSNRRNHVATKLLDAVRKSFCADSILELSQMAFSQPTPAGRALASSYCGTGSFLVYNTGLKC
ncbi:hypothetical protein Scep_004023 [Stephania cephalantha]|uniref:N-acetyltransferase ESCO2 n=1 Tax=Stephania cephalantha TaxID=152367 RepID=A0AAP0PWW2_9MAGN